MTACYLLEAQIILHQEIYNPDNETNVTFNLDPTKNFRKIDIIMKKPIENSEVYHLLYVKSENNIAFSASELATVLREQATYLIGNPIKTIKCTCGEMRYDQQEYIEHVKTKHGGKSPKNSTHDKNGNLK